MRGTADSLREALSVCFTLLNERHNKDLSRCARVQLPKQPTLLCVHEENIAADPAHDAYSLLITINIFLACAVSVATVYVRTRNMDTRALALPPNQIISLP